MSTQPSWRSPEDVVSSTVSRRPRLTGFWVFLSPPGLPCGTKPKKILTMMFYVPLSDATVYDFGTCLHTTAQYRVRAGGVALSIRQAQKCRRIKFRLQAWSSTLYAD